MGNVFGDQVSQTISDIGEPNDIEVPPLTRIGGETGFMEFKITDVAEYDALKDLVVSRVSDSNIEFTIATARVAMVCVGLVLLVACGGSVELVGTQAKESFGLDYKVHVECTVKNTGKARDVTVEAELNKGGWWKKEKTERVLGGETKTIRVTFSEPTFLQGGLSEGEYSCRLT